MYKKAVDSNSNRNVNFIGNNGIDNLLDNYPAVMSISQVADILHVSTKTISRLLSAGKIERLNMYQVRITRTALLNFLHENYASKTA